MLIMAIDPGPKESAAVIYDDESHRLVEHSKTDNYEILDWLQGDPIGTSPSLVAIEMIASYGMPVGAETFETCVWIGRYLQAWGHPYRLVYRREVKLHLCGSVRAKDGNVRRALLDRFGPGKAAAVGTTAVPGPLYGVKRDVWQALAVAVTVGDDLASKRHELISAAVASSNSESAVQTRRVRKS